MPYDSGFFSDLQMVVREGDGNRVDVVELGHRSCGPFDKHEIGAD